MKRKCRVCGCTDEQACIGGCWWVEADLCSTCKRKEANVKKIRRERDPKGRKRPGG